MNNHISEHQDDGSRGQSYKLAIGNDRLEYSEIRIHDPVPTGMQILLAAGVTQPVEHLLFQMLHNGLLEEIRPDETTDLRSAGVEKFLIFRSDRTFRFQLDDRSFDWGAVHISGATLKKLAGVDINNNNLWLDTRGGSDCLIGNTDLADLSKPGVERFFTNPVAITIFVNGRPREVHQPRLSYWEVVKLAFPDAVPSDQVIYTIDYSCGPHANPEGAMVDGQHVQIKDGMKFYVTPTDKS